MRYSIVLIPEPEEGGCSVIVVRSGDEVPEEREPLVLTQVETPPAPLS